MGIQRYLTKGLLLGLLLDWGVISATEIEKILDANKDYSIGCCVIAVSYTHLTLPTKRIV